MEKEEPMEEKGWENIEADAPMMPSRREKKEKTNKEKEETPKENEENDNKK